MMEAIATPQLVVPTANDAIATVNRWLHRNVGLAVHATTATFDPETFYWHLPLELSYATTGTLGIVGDVYLHAATGAFAGSPDANEFQQRAEALAVAHEIE